MTSARRTALVAGVLYLVTFAVRHSEEATR